MSGSKKKTTVADVLRDLNEDAFWMPIEMVHRELDEAGLNTPERRARTQALFERLNREHRRRSWQDAASRDRQEISQKLHDLQPRILARARELMDQGHPKLLLACSGRRPEAMDDDELLSIAEDLAQAELLEELDDG